MHSRKSVKAALVNQIDAVQLTISRLQAELVTGCKSNRNSRRCGYELNAQKARLVRLQAVLANYPSGPISGDGQPQAGSDSTHTWSSGRSHPRSEPQRCV